jgi:hypothetical protein
MKCIISLRHTLLFVLILFFASCNNGFDDCNNTIHFENKSNRTIYAVSTLKEGFFNFDPTNEIYASDFKVKPDGVISVKIGIKLSCWEQTLEQTGGYVYIYIYDAEVLENPDNRWEDQKNQYIKKYKLSAKDLKGMGWKVKFS